MGLRRNARKIVKAEREIIEMQRDAMRREADADKPWYLQRTIGEAIRTTAARRHATREAE